MNKFILAATAALMAAGTAMPALAASINAKQIEQRRQIDAGARSGKLTSGEVSRLRNEQRRIELAKAERKARGGYGRADERAIHAMQDRAGMHIRMAKHNGRRAPSKRILGAKVF